MFSNPIYNLPSQFNENLLTQNLAGLSLNRAQPYQDQQQQQQQPQQQQQQQQQSQQQQQNVDFETLQYSQQQQMPNDAEGYVPQTFDDTNVKWSSPDEVSAAYQRGSPFVRQYNNSMIDDYYKKFVRPITDYVAIPTTGQPTYVYQSLDGQQTTNEPLPTQQSMSGGNTMPNELNSSIFTNVSQTNTDGAEEKKHKKKHKKRSSKHSHGDSSKHNDTEKLIDERKNELNDDVDVQQTPPMGLNEHIGNTYHQQQQLATTLSESKLNGGGPQIPMKHEANPVVYFDIEIDGDPRGRLIMELFRHVLPRTAQNFLSLCLNEHGFGFRLSYFHRIIPGFMAQGGDFEKSNGTGGYSIYGEKFEDEGFPYLHDRAGLLSMANSGPNTNGSQFFITFVPCPHLDNKHVVFGQVLQGFHILKDLDLSGSENGDVSREVKIANCDQLQ
ncbi:unnamed protein product [Adineta steineri]|uniref:peptidylprolyl isomerase n=1 Tax=Adineta steineri TaxID=433720 RepID=A0A818PV67_9BILA|nr:unnamed protein product [Adineta steineri]